jgi:hypothetical protein
VGKKQRLPISILNPDLVEDLLERLRVVDYGEYLMVEVGAFRKYVVRKSRVEEDLTKLLNMVPLTCSEIPILLALLSIHIDFDLRKVRINRRCSSMYNELTEALVNMPKSRKPWWHFW